MKTKYNELILTIEVENNDILELKKRFFSERSEKFLEPLKIKLNTKEKTKAYGLYCVKINSYFNNIFEIEPFFRLVSKSCPNGIRCRINQFAIDTKEMCLSPIDRYYYECDGILEFK